MDSAAPTLASTGASTGGGGDAPRLPGLRVSAAALWSYAALIAVLLAVKLLFTLAPTRFPLADQGTAFAWLTVLGIATVGLLGLVLAPRAGFPDMWDPAVSARQRLVLPAVDGVLYGLLTVARDVARPIDVHLAFPASIPFYTFGAIFLEILLRLVGLTGLTWLFAEVILRPLFLANVLTGYLYRRFGFIAAIVLRLAFYAVWHVAYGGFRPFWLSRF